MVSKWLCFSGVLFAGKNSYCMVTAKKPGLRMNHRTGNQHLRQNQRQKADGKRAPELDDAFASMEDCWLTRPMLRPNHRPKNPNMPNMEYRYIMPPDKNAANVPVPVAALAAEP